MTVYAIALLSIHDMARYRRYAARFVGSLDGFDGRLLAVDEHPDLIAGDRGADKVVLLRFSHRHEFYRWATSEHYRTVAEDRHAAARATVMLIDGIDQPTTTGTGHARAG